MAGPETPAEVKAVVQQADAEFEQESDPEWFAEYGQNLADYTHWLFGDRYRAAPGGSPAT
ncbi:hypothetical protein GCM10022239_11640 [Leifsonia bigeumensis]|uniref:Uncharacterized protein n=1 Tax=Leifsonella bigeumensis TaxID=433643 RepID=A0ABP7FEC6_9MICO